MFAHDASNTLWVCTNDPDPQGKEAVLKAFDLKTAAPKGAYPFPNGGLCNDIAVTGDGTTLATDTRGGRILALKPGSNALTVWAPDPTMVRNAKAKARAAIGPAPRNRWPLNRGRSWK